VFAFLFDSIAGVRSNTLISSFSSRDNSGSFLANIDWGDGTTSAGAVTSRGKDPVQGTVHAGHVYAAPGTYNVTSTILDVVNNTTGATSIAVVVAPAAALKPFNEIAPVTLSVGSSPSRIVPGPDGALWFTESGAGRIGRVDTAGFLTEFSGPALGPDDMPLGITLGPDGNLWFVDAPTNHVDRITPLGVITSFLIPTFDGRPSAIVTGPDLNLWFTESNANQVGQVVMPEGVIPTGVGLAATPGRPITAAFGQFADRSTLVDLARFFLADVAFGDGTFAPGSLVDGPVGGAGAMATHAYAAGVYRGQVVLHDPIGATAPAPLTATVSLPSPPPPSPPPLPPLSFVVTNTNDAGPGSLRQAILNADRVPGRTITFAIPAAGGRASTITLASALPLLTVPTAIDGFSGGSTRGSPRRPRWSRSTAGPSPAPRPGSSSPAPAARSGGWRFSGLAAP